MKLAELSIKRPVLAIVINLVVILLGLVSYQRLTLREYPSIDVPEVTVDTSYPGASASIMETQVTKPLEDSLSGIEGIDYIKSISRSERSQITIRFTLGRDPDAAASDVRDRVARVRGVMPEEIDEPVVTKAEADAQPIIWLALSSDRHSPLDVSETANIIVKDRLQTISGVSSVLVFAERKYSMRIWLNPDKLAAYQLTTQDIEDALRAQNVEIPSGRIESRKREFTVLMQTDLNTPEQFEQIIVKRTPEGHQVRMKDVARVGLAAKEERSLVRYNNRNSVALGVIRQSVANPLEISEKIRAALPELERVIPEGMKVEVAYDSSVFIQESLHAVQKTIAEAVGLVVLVIFFFLRTFRATVIPLVTIPISLIGAMSIMYMLGFSINTLTLLAFVIAIGLVVDDAIVVLENIYRHIEEGLDPIHAAVKGVREIGFAVVAMTLTLAAVFAPMAFGTGRTDKLFAEFALTLAGAVVVSGFTALTLSPMMCSRLLKNTHDHQPRWSQRIENFLNRLDAAYKRVLCTMLRRRYIMFGMVALMLVLSAILLKFTPQELSPQEDRGVLFAVGISPEGSTIDYSDAYAKQIEKILQSAKEAQWNFTAIGFPQITQTFGVLGLKPWSERSRSSLEIVGEVAPQLFGITGILAFAINPPSLGQSPVSQPVEFVVQTTDTYENLDKIMAQVMQKVHANPRIIAPDVDLKLNKPELKVEANREKIADMGIRLEQVGRTLETMLGGRDVTRFKRKGEQYDVVVQMEDDERRNPTDLTRIFARTPSGEMVQLSNLLTMQESVAPRELNRFNKLRAATITANLAPGYSMGEALNFLEQTVREVAPTSQVDYGGQSREFRQASASFLFLLGLALAFIYLVLAAQFESFRDPFIILLSVLPAATGALLAMKLTGGSLNVYSQIGLIALIGLISKHGIMIVEFANQLQEKGKDVFDAVAESAAIRLRPILMTTCATVLGSFPLAIAAGAGAESRQAIGWVLVGGMTLGTLMTIFVVPTFYTLISRVRHMVQIDETKISA